MGEQARSRLGMPLARDRLAADRVFTRSGTRRASFLLRMARRRQHSGGEVDGVRELKPSGHRPMLRGTITHPDEVLFISTRFSLGFNDVAAGRGARPQSAFVRPSGAGGSPGFADPDAKVGFGYTTNQMAPGILIDPRATALIDAAYESLWGRYFGFWRERSSRDRSSRAVRSAV